MPNRFDFGFRISQKIIVVARNEAISNFLVWHEINIKILLTYATIYDTILFKFLGTADVIKRWRSTETVLQQAVSSVTQVASGRQSSSSFSLLARDRATRLRSSDAPRNSEGQPDAKDQDVVAVQLWLF
jgi:hypothetical protein